MQFAVGEKVSRPTDVYRPSKLKHGTITSVYCSLPTRGYPYRNSELYSVQWRGEPRESFGYFPHGIDREEA